jgi:hypothetical protein
VSVTDAFLLFAALATLLVFGHGLTNLLAGDTPLYRSEKLGIAYILGTGAASIAWLLLAPVYRAIPAIVAVSAIAWTVAAAGLVRTNARLRPAADRVQRWWAVPVAALVFVQVIALAYAAMRTDLGWDAVWNFEMKARLAFENGTRGQMPLAFFSDESRAWSHPRYPLLLPFAEFWIYAWLGRVDQHLVKVLFPFFYVALLCVVAGAVRRLSSAGTALLAVAALGTLPPLTVIPGAISGYAEVPLAAAIAAATACALAALHNRRNHGFWLAGALAAVGAWTKVEGALLALCLGAAVMMVAGRRAAPLIVIPLCVIGPWTIFQQLYGIPERDFPSLSPLVALGNLDRLPVIARMAARELITPGHWGLLWPSFAVIAAMALAQRRLRDSHLVLTSVVLVPLCVYAASYLFSGWTDVEGHIGTSFVRLLVPLAPVAIMFAAAQLSPARAEAKAA